jgi:hypothetical protein
MYMALRIEMKVVPEHDNIHWDRIENEDDDIE